MDLQPPSVLAQLPRPLHASTGKTRIGEVFRLADSKKRKRYEVAVAVDGEAVNIYNVRTGITSLIAQVNAKMSALDPNPQVGHVLCRSAEILLHLPALLGAQKALEQVNGEKADLCRHQSPAGDQVLR